ncbi:MAG: hypothetical protein H0X24_19555 [Ktedonobacterales bacterium]|nr:hypothetical protein [Ktedonobacterales bacterium]
MYRFLGRLCYGLSAASVLLSLGTQFRMAQGKSAKAQAFFQRRPPTNPRSERQSIFFGLWAPTLAIFGKVLEDMGREQEMRQALDGTTTSQKSINGFDRSEQQLTSAR